MSNRPSRRSSRRLPLANQGSKRRSPSSVHGRVNAAALEKQGYYHGNILTEDVSELLVKPGDFLTRLAEDPDDTPSKTEPPSRITFVSICVEGNPPDPTPVIIHIPMGRDRKKYFFHGGELMFQQRSQLIDYYRTEKKPVAPQDPRTVLVNPINRASWEIPHEDLKIENFITMGNFGELSQAVWTKSAIKTEFVIVKVIKESFGERLNQRLKLAKVLRTFDHPHVVRVVGIACIRNPLMIVMENMDCTMKGYFEKAVANGAEKDVSIKERVERMILPIAWALEYLLYRNWIHRCIRAETVLWSTEKAAKLGGFGRSRPGPTSKGYEQGCTLALRWLAPEAALNELFTFATDLWAYGCYCFEVLTDCQLLPFPEVQSREELFDYFAKNTRLAMPADTPRRLCNIFDQMIFVADDKRATINEVAKKMEEYAKMPTPEDQLKYRNGSHMSDRAQKDSKRSS